MKPRRDPATVANLLASGAPQLTELIHRSRYLAEITRSVRAALPPALAEHCIGVNLSATRLTLYTDAPAWAARLRYQQDDILTGLTRDLGLRLEQVLVRVMPPEQLPGLAAGVPPQPLSDQTRAHLRTVAESCDDPELADALRRLADASHEGPR